MTSCAGTPPELKPVRFDGLQIKKTYWGHLSFLAVTHGAANLPPAGLRPGRWLTPLFSNPYRQVTPKYWRSQKQKIGLGKESLGRGRELAPWTLILKALFQQPVEVVLKPGPAVKVQAPAGLRLPAGQPEERATDKRWP